MIHGRTRLEVTEVTLKNRETWYVVGDVGNHAIQSSPIRTSKTVILGENLSLTQVSDLLKLREAGAA